MRIFNARLPPISGPAEWATLPERSRLLSSMVSFRSPLVKFEVAGIISSSTPGHPFTCHQILGMKQGIKQLLTFVTCAVTLHVCSLAYL